VHEGEDWIGEEPIEVIEEEEQPEVALEREARGWCGGRGFDESGYGYGAYAASDD
jgi:hypothetical protein